MDVDKQCWSVDRSGNIITVSQGRFPNNEYMRFDLDNDNDLDLLVALYEILSEITLR